MLKMLCIISNPTGWSGEGGLGGGEIRAVEILKRWHSWGVYVETLETCPSPSMLMGADYKIHAFRPLLKGENSVIALVNTLMLFLACLRNLLLTRERFDVVISSNSSLSDVAPAWIISRIRKIPLIIVFQITRYASSLKGIYRLIKEEEEYGSLGLILNACSAYVSLKLATTASAIICLSSNIADMLQKIGFSAEKLHVNGMGINLIDIEETEAGESLYDGVFLGRAERSKGLKDVIEAWKIIAYKKPNAKILIIGSGSFLNDAKKLVEEKGIKDNVEFTGFISGNKKFQYLKKSKIFVSPSKVKEGWGLSIGEALACGLPVVCYDNPVFMSVFGLCKSVFSVRTGNIKELANMILNLLSDEEKLRRYSEVSKAFVKEYTWESVAKLELETIKAQTLMSTQNIFKIA